MSKTDKPLVWQSGEVKSPPFSAKARVEAGVLIRKLQRGGNLSLTYSRPMPSIGKRCHELRINDENKTWRIVYRIDRDAIVIADVFAKKTRTTSGPIIKRCKARFTAYDKATR